MVLEEARPPPREPEHVEPGGVRWGWQHSAASEVVTCARDEWFIRANDQVRALVRSQGGPGAGAALTAVPSGRETTIPSHLFRVILLRRLRQQLPFTGRADVAVSSTFLATIAQHVPVLGCFDAEFRIGECRCKNLQRGRGPSAHQHLPPGLGHSHSNVGGQPPIGGRG